jgi:hypothetical protein
MPHLRKSQGHYILMSVIIKRLDLLDDERHPVGAWVASANIGRRDELSLQHEPVGWRDGMQRRPARPCGHPSGIDVSVALIRLAICIGSRLACNADPLASSGRPAVVAMEVSVRTGPIPKELRGLIRRMARENSAWGQERIANELLLKLGLRVSPRTLGKYMPRPAPGARAEINDGRPLLQSCTGHRRV